MCPWEISNIFGILNSHRDNPYSIAIETSLHIHPGARERHLPVLGDVRKKHFGGFGAESTEGGSSTTLTVDAEHLRKAWKQMKPRLH